MLFFVKFSRKGFILENAVGRQHLDGISPVSRFSERPGNFSLSERFDLIYLVGIRIYDMDTAGDTWIKGMDRP